MSENKIKFPVKLASNNPQSFGIADATEVSGHRTVDTLSDLYAISDPVLSILKDGSDAVGQEWFVVSEDCKYRLDNWENRKSIAGWTKLPKQELINIKQSVSEKNQPNGYAGLDSNGKLPIEKTYGDTATVVEVETYELLPVTGLSGVIYYVSSTSAQYKWSGSAYINITDGADNAKKNETSIFDCSNGTSTKYYSSLSAAINVVPPVYRTSNRIISYLSTESSPTSAVNYQYHGIDSTTWTDLTKWERIPNQTDLAEIRSDLSENTDKLTELALKVDKTLIEIDDYDVVVPGNTSYSPNILIPAGDYTITNTTGMSCSVAANDGTIIIGSLNAHSQKDVSIPNDIIWGESWFGEAGVIRISNKKNITARVNKIESLFENACFIDDFEGNDREKLQIAFMSLKDTGGTIIITREISLTNDIVIENNPDSTSIINVVGLGKAIINSGNYCFRGIAFNSGHISFTNIKFVGNPDYALFNCNNLIRLSFINCHFFFCGIVFLANENIIQDIVLDSCRIRFSNVFYSEQATYAVSVTNSTIESCEYFAQLYGGNGGTNGFRVSNCCIEGIRKYVLFAAGYAMGISFTQNYFELNSTDNSSASVCQFNLYPVNSLRMINISDNLFAGFNSENENKPIIKLPFGRDITSGKIVVKYNAINDITNEKTPLVGWTYSHDFLVFENNEFPNTGL